MPRPKQFDPDQALDEAMVVFWKRGYDATSLRNLEQGMGINRFSLYATFDSKHELFLKALDRYSEGVVSTLLLKELEAPDAALPAIHAYFTNVVGAMVDGDGARGCLMVNSAAELGRRDRAAARKIRAHVHRMETAFYRALVRAAAQGQIDPGRDLRAVSRHLTATAQGLALLGKLIQERDFLEDIANSALTALR